MPDNFDPDKYLASEDFDPEVYLKETNPPPLDPFNAVLAKGSQGLTGGYADEILGGIEAGAAKMTGDERSLGDVYREKRNVHRLRAAQASHDQPKTAAAADMAGSLALGLSPVGRALGPSAKLGTAANLGKASATGALISAGGSNTDLTKGPEGLSKFGADVGKGAVLGGAVQGLASPMSYVAGKFAPGVLAQSAELRAVKAAIGQNKGAFTKMQQEGSLQKTGRDLLSDEAGGPAVGYFSNAEDILPKIQAKKQFYGQKIGKVGEAIDAASPGAVDPASIAQKLKEELKGIPAMPKNSGVRDALQKEIDYYETKGLQAGVQGPASPMSFSEAQSHKGQYVFKPTDSTTQTLGQDVTNKARSAVGAEMEDAAKRIANDPNTPMSTKDLLDQYGKLKSKYGSFANAEKYGEKKVMGDLSNRVVSPSDYGAAAATGIASAAAGNPLPAVQAGIAGVANKQLRERGSAFAARTMDKLSQIMASDPAGLNRFRSALERASSEGPQSLMLTHALLAEDPSYREVIENYKAGEKK